MGHTLFAASLMPARSRSAAAAVPFSLGVHAAAVGGLLAVPLLGSANPPPVPVRAPIIETIPIAVPRVTVVPPPAAPTRPGPRSASRAPDRPVEEAPATTPVPLTADPPPLADTAHDGAGCAGCALTTDPGPSGSGVPGFPPGSTGPGVGDGTGSAPLVVGPQVAAPAKLRHVDPEYPELAKRAGVQGQVVIECIIDRDGRVASTRLVRSIPVLDAAAVAAVEQWRYRPTLLRGVPVAVLMTVTVNFRLR